MSVFENYASYYDLLYRDKDYAGEADFVHSLINKYSNDAKLILELGCGTGGHAEHLVKLDYTVHGVDISTDMLKMAAVRHARLDQKLKDNILFEKGDIRTTRLDQQFDVVLSLFHVISYQTSNEDLSQAFMTAKEHLNSGGIFIFDCWYGPGVLTDRPESRIKRWEDEKIYVMRTAEPIMHPNENVVDVNYQVSITEKSTNKVSNIQETHRMRYLFKPEVDFLLSSAGFTTETCVEFLSNKEPGFQSWNVCFIARV